MVMRYTDEPSGSSNNDSLSIPQYYYLPIDDAVEKIGTGPFQYKLLLAAGLCFMSDAMEVLLLSFLSTVLKHEWQLSEPQVDSIVSVVFAGAILGTLVLGRAGDVWGRRPVFLVTAALISVAGVATACCRTYPVLLLMRFWVGFGVGGLTVPFDTLGEFLPGSVRGKNLLGIEFFWTFGTMSVPTLAYLTLDTSSVNGGGGSHWQLFVVLCSVPCFLSACLGLVVVPESPRWLLEQQSSEEDPGGDSYAARALEILKSAARANGISQSKIDQKLFPPNTILVLSLNDDQAEHCITKNNDNHYDKVPDINTTINKASNSNYLTGFGELFRTPDLSRVTLLLWGTWFGFGFLYYGVILTVSLVFTNEKTTADDSYNFDYAAIFFTSSAELIGLLVVFCIIDLIGRIPSQTMAYRIGGVSTCLMCLLCARRIDHDFSFYRPTLIALAFLSRGAMMASCCTTWVSTSEMLATEIRSTGHGAANAFCRLGGFVAPYVMTEGNSMGTIGVVALLVALGTAECSVRLPETKGRPMGEVGRRVVLAVNKDNKEPSTTCHELS